jgi:hypothetical protein
MKAIRFASFVVALVALFAAGCGGSNNGGGGGGGATPTSISNITYTPNPVAPNGTASFTGIVNCSGTGTCPQSITWSAAAGQGSFAGSTYTAPAASGSYTVTATATGYSVSATATVTVASALSVSLTCPPLVQIGVQGNVVPPTSYVCTASASDGKGVTYAANGVGMSINSSTGKLTVTASDSDIGNNNYLPVTVTATASDGKTSASTTVLVTDWFLAENGQGTQIMTSTGTVVQSFRSLAYSAEAFAPDHLSFVGLRNDFSGFDVYAVTVTSTNGTVSVGVGPPGKIALVSGFDDVATPSYSTDGTMLVFVGSIYSTKSQGVYTIAVNGETAEKQLSTELPAAISVGTDYPHFTADGKSIVFQHYVNVNGTPQTQIWEMAADGSNQTPLITTPGSGSPFPTADGRYLMFWLNNTIYQANSDGSGAELVIQAPTSAFGANGELEAISPDGKRIMYLMKDPVNGGYWYLWTANVDGSDAVQITPDSGAISPESWGD